MEIPIYNHGKHCASWVCALETLVHSGAAWVGKLDVLKHLQKREFRCTKLAVKRFLHKVGTKKEHFEDFTFVQHLCWLLYEARNDFMHGNELKEETFLPPEIKKGVRLLDVASLLYQTALESDRLPETGLFVSDRLGKAFLRIMADDGCGTP